MWSVVISSNRSALLFSDSSACLSTRPKANCKASSFAKVVQRKPKTLSRSSLSCVQRRRAVAPIYKKKVGKNTSTTRVRRGENRARKIHAQSEPRTMRVMKWLCTLARKRFELVLDHFPSALECAFFSVFVLFRSPLEQFRNLISSVLMRELPRNSKCLPMTFSRHSPPQKLQLMTQKPQYDGRFVLRCCDTCEYFSSARRRVGLQIH